MKYASLAAAFAVIAPLSAFAEGDAARGEAAAGQCKACHQFGEGARNGFGPVLNGVIGRQAGTFEGYRYSDSVAAAGEQGLVWDEDTIVQWLNGPSDFMREYLGDEAAKSKMTFRISNEEQRRDIAAFLKTLSPEMTEMDGENVEMSHGGAAFDMDVMSSAEEVDPNIGLPEGIERVRQELVVPPFAPEHTVKAEGDPKVVEVELVVEEKKMVIDSIGTTINALTFNGSVPAPLIVAHEGDWVELTLKNPDTNVMEHNIDLHSVTGALGGAGLTTISPGEEATIRFQLTKTGAFLYHCAPEGTMTPYHTTHGMTGSILVLPREGLQDRDGNELSYDKLYYVGENSFYVPKNEGGSYKEYENTADDFTDWVKEMRGLIPTHVVFNGRVGALTGENAMTADVGDNVMFLHMVPNRDTRPHLIGGHWDYAWERGAFANAPVEDLETALVAGGSTAAFLYEFKMPGVYVYLNHNLIEAVELGAAAHVVVEGEWDDSILTQLYHGEMREE